MKKIGRILPGLLAASLVFAACGGEQADTTTLRLEKKGTLVQEIVEPAGDDAFTEKELREYIEEELASCGETAGSGRVELESCSVSDGTVKIRMSYASAGDYAGYNHVECFSGTVREAEEAGYSFDRNFTDAGGNPVDSGEVLSEEDSRILIVEEYMEIELPGKLLYMTDNAAAGGEQRAAVKEPEDSGDSLYGITDEPVYLIYS